MPTHPQNASAPAQRSAKQLLAYYENQSGNWLATANAIKERGGDGSRERAEEIYRKATRYLMKANSARERMARENRKRMEQNAPELLAALGGLLGAFRECVGSEAFADFETANPAVIYAKSIQSRILFHE